MNGFTMPRRYIRHAAGRADCAAADIYGARTYTRHSLLLADTVAMMMTRHARRASHAQVYHDTAMIFFSLALKMQDTLSCALMPRDGGAWAHRYRARRRRISRRAPSAAAWPGHMIGPPCAQKITCASPFSRAFIAYKDFARASHARSCAEKRFSFRHRFTGTGRQISLRALLLL